MADKNSKVDETAQEYGVTLEQKPIALDAFIFMANEANPVTSLTYVEGTEGTDGTLYQRIFVKDEERSDLEWAEE